MLMNRWSTLSRFAQGDVEDSDAEEARTGDGVRFASWITGERLRKQLVRAREGNQLGPSEPIMAAWASRWPSYKAKIRRREDSLVDRQW